MSTAIQKAGNSPKRRSGRSRAATSPRPETWDSPRVRPRGRQVVWRPPPVDQNHCTSRGNTDTANRSIREPTVLLFLSTCVCTCVPVCACVYVKKDVHMLLTLVLSEEQNCREFNFQL